MRISKLRRQFLWCSGLLSLSYVLLGTTLIRKTTFYAILVSQFGGYGVYSFGLPSRHPSEDLEDSGAHDRKTKWIVLTTTTVFSPSEFAFQFNSVDWTVLLVTDQSTPIAWSYPNLKILHLEEQLSLGYKVLKFLPNNKQHYARKIIGYLYAIQNGAKFIYDATDFNKINATTLENSLVLKKSTRGLTLASDAHVNSVIDPYAHFGQPDTPRMGFPYSHSEKSLSSSYIGCKMKTPIIQQTMATKYQEFDGNAPPIIISKSLFAPFDSKSTLFHYDAFWALLLPMSVPEEDADIWRGYWAQPLLWSIGAKLGYFPEINGDTNVNNTNSEAPSPALFDDSQMEKLRSLIEFLKTWSCSETHMYSCMLTLTSLIVQKHILPDTELELLQAWISDLNTVGYKPPELSTSIASQLPCLPGSTQSAVMFNPRSISKQPSKTNRHHLLEFCDLPVPETETSAQTQKHYFPSTLLVVVFNYPHYDNIWLLDLMYRPHFPNIVYCGPLDDPNDLTHALAREEFKKTSKGGISFIKANPMVGEGCMNYECALRAIDMNYNVEGYLLIQDDVLLNIWNIGKYNKNEAWMQKGNMRRVVYTHLPTSSVKNWVWWGSQFGKGAITNSLKEIYRESKNTHVKQFREDRESYGYNETKVVFSESELFYFPASKKEVFYEIGSILRYFEVYLELAAPFILSGLSSPQNLEMMPGEDLWGKNRLIPFTFFFEFRDWLHPLKFSEVFKIGDLKKNYCDLYVSRLLRE